MRKHKISNQHKGFLILLIRREGDCSNISCSYCPLICRSEFLGTGYKEICKYRYEEAIACFIEQFSKEELVEILI